MKPPRGFTLIELLVSIAIIGIVTSLVLVRYGSFDSTTILKNAAYDVALALREAQIRSISVVRSFSNGNTPNFDIAYGISLAPETALYTAFRYASSTSQPRYEGSDSELIDAFDFAGRAVRVTDLCIQKAPAEPECDLNRLDVSFRRPEFNALVYALDSDDSPISNPDQITETQIHLASGENETNIFVVKVTQFGQISVCKSDSPSCL